MHSRSIYAAFGRTACLTLICVGGAAQADQLSLDINDDAARLTYTHALAAGNTQVDASWLHHQDRGDVLAVGFQLIGNAATENKPINAGVGGRVIYVDVDGVNADGGGLAVGGFFDAKIPDYNRFGVGGHVYYAPDVLAFGDVSDALDISVYASYSVLREGEVYVGFRNVKADFDGGGSFTFDTGIHVGFRLNF
ncbi:MAG: YfaZ family outer membrane protein [Pseudomonadota bacterium]